MDKLFELPEIVTLAGQPLGLDADSAMLVAAGGNACGAGSGTSNACSPGAGGAELDQ